MSEITPKQAYNYRSLLEGGAIMVSMSGYTFDKPPAALADVPTSEPLKAVGEINITGVDRFTALAIARGLANKLDGKDVEDKDDTLKKNIIESSDLSSEKSPVIFSEAPEAGNFSVIVGEADFGKYFLQADIRGKLKEHESEAGRLYLHKTFGVVMDSLSIRPISGIEEPLPEVDQTLRAYERETRQPGLGRIARRIARKEERDEARKFREDLKEARYIAALMGLEDAFTADKNEMVELWRSRNDATDILELFLYTIYDKQDIYGTKRYFYTNSLQDLKQNGELMRPFDLRRYLEDQTVRVFTEELHISEDDAKSALEDLAEEWDKLKLHFVAWLSSQQDMMGFRAEVKAAVEKRRIHSEELFNEAIKHIVNVGGEHVQRRKIPELNRYNPGIGYHSDAYNRRREFFKTAWLIANYLYTDLDLSDLLGVED